MTLVTQEAWPFQPELCPADVDFCRWADSVNLIGSRILHMGTGEHHLVGKHLWSTNQILGLTLSEEELRWYVKALEQVPDMMRTYHVQFLDIHAWNSMMFGDFDIINLPHFGEMVDPRRNNYTDPDLHFTLEKLLDSRSGPGALVTGYARSSAWDRSYPIFESILGKPSFQYMSIVGWETN